MAHTAPLYQENGDSVAVRHGAGRTPVTTWDPPNKLHHKEMAIGGMDTVPIMSDAGVQASART
jgi:hypothetical protein